MYRNVKITGTMRKHVIVFKFPHVTCEDDSILYPNDQGEWTSYFSGILWRTVCNPQWSGGTLYIVTYNL